MTATLTKTRTYHLITEFAVTLRDRLDSRDEDAIVVARALWANPAILDKYLAYRTAWHMMLELNAEGDGLCAALGVPEDSGDLFPLLLGLHLPPSTRAYLQQLHRGSGDREDDSAYYFAEVLADMIAVDWTVADHHLAAD